MACANGFILNHLNERKNKMLAYVYTLQSDILVKALNLPPEFHYS